MPDLPDEVVFAKWLKYQHTNATHYVRVECGVLYDQRIVGPRGRASDLALSTFLRGIILAVSGQGRCSIRAWIGQCPDRKRAASQIKLWLDNGFLEAVPPQIDREIDTTTTTTPPASPSAGVDKSPERRKPRARKEPPEQLSWSTRFADELAKHRGGVANYGRVGKALRAVVARDGELALWPPWQRFCASAKAAYGPEWFASNVVEFSGAPLPGKDADDAIALTIKRKLSPGPQFPNQWDLSTASAEERRVFAARGGAFNIWNDNGQHRRPT